MIVNPYDAQACSMQLPGLALAICRLMCAEDFATSCQQAVAGKHDVHDDHKRAFGPCRSLYSNLLAIVVVNPGWLWQPDTGSTMPITQVLDMSATICLADLQAPCLHGCSLMLTGKLELHYSLR